ncbi:HAD family hydrolase [Aquisalinus flavus]|uniref:dUMP phosphatase n=1 Tax=Aquisalinus flavus TaxID=1526572 RepID=A0A8J2V2I2_9PROT|nr:HAD family hydrolase [Aquisalinus flavus]MBD0427400.1 HAD family hydrolase [Aquisalinus flavus]UNE47203.1 HAD family hydrolase [Aquisalinus flavus]GGD00684.1 dUMP phosphatase [Aquisalinus flavus]
MKHKSTDKNSWVIFDADNTLWELEPIYDAARDEFAAYLSDALGNAPEEIIAFQRQRDAEIFAFLGYSKERFPQSFLDTAAHFLQGKKDAEVMRKAKKIGASVFEKDITPFEGVAEVLSELAEEKHLGLITGGDKAVQKKRLASFRYKDFFGDQFMIVHKKDARTFQKFCIKYDVDVRNSWMVGDSIRSDMLPADAIGLNTIYVTHDNWHEVERHNLKLPKRTFIANSITEVPDIILPKFELSFALP